MSSKPTVAVIIPAFNEEEVMDECVKSLIDQTYSSLEIHIVDDASQDRTWEILSSWQSRYPERLFIHQFGKIGPGHARNHLAKEVSTEILAFMDADCIAFPDWVEKLVEALSETSAASVGGPHLAPPESNAFQRQLDQFFSSLSPLISFFKSSNERQSTDHNPLCNVAYRREIFLALNGFREDLFPGEDYEFDLRLRRAGHKIFYEPKAKVYHHRPKTMRDFQKVMRAYGRAQGKIFREYGPTRRMHGLALLALSFPLIWILIFIYQPFSLPLFVSALGLFTLFYFWPFPFGLVFSLGHWLRGFVWGLLTNQSPPPVASPISKAS